MSAVATAIIGGAVLGAGASIYGSRQAGKAASGAAGSATAESARQFDIIRGDTLPYIRTGQAALGTLARLYGLQPDLSTGEGPGGAQVGAKTFKPSELQTLLDQGLSIDDILQLGVFESGAKTSDIQRLMQQYNLSAGDISRLQQGRFSTAGNTLQGNIVGVKPDGTPIYGVAQGPGGTQGKPDLSVFTASPDYQFNLEQGEQAINRSLAARTGVLSGRAVKEGQRYASGLASQEFGNFFERLARIAGLGGAATNTSAGAGIATAGNIANIQSNLGSSRASAYLIGAQGVNSAIQGGLSNWTLLNYLNRSGGIPNAEAYSQ